jgi:hypothetical protein
LNSYFPYFIEETKSIFPSIEEMVDIISSATKKTVSMRRFPLPKDIKDKFAASCWAFPERYLDAAIRNGISSFQRMPAQLLADGLAKLKHDLESGDWLVKHGEILNFDEYDAGYYFISAAKE